jgi:hypothetical protein
VIVFKLSSLQEIKATVKIIRVNIFSIFYLLMVCQNEIIIAANHLFAVIVLISYLVYTSNVL